MKMMNIISSNFPDPEKIRDQLRDYYGTAMMNGFPTAMGELNELEELSDEEIMELAQRNDLK